MVGIQIVASAILFVPGVIADHGGMSHHTGTRKIIVGLVLLLLIIPSIIKKRKQGGKERVPKLFNSLDKFGVVKIFLIGFAFSALSVENVALSASGAAHITCHLFNRLLRNIVSRIFLFADCKYFYHYPDCDLFFSPLKNGRHPIKMEKLVD